MSATHNSILAGIRASMDATAAAAPAAAATAGSRKPSDFWLNVGVTIPGGGKDGADLFISLPNGLALDDMKPTKVSGNNSEWIALAQAKNAFLEEVQKAAAGLKPGERVVVPMFTVELYRRAEPSQIADASSNSLVSQLLGVLGKTPATV